MKNRVWFFHLLNDFSGSPLVLKNTISALKSKVHVTVCTSKGGGFLSNFGGINYHYTNYKWSSSKIETLVRFFRVQISLFFLVVLKRKKIDVVYINTLLPFGAALGAWCCGKKVIYHMHEPQVNPKILFAFLCLVAEKTADVTLFVSNYLQKCFPKLAKRGFVVPNVLNNEFLQNIKRSDVCDRGSVLMLCSFKEYKGINDFVSLSKLNKGIEFNLVLNSSVDSIKNFVSDHRGLLNLNIYSSQENVQPFYEKARVVLNLSQPTKWIESFGMTALEAMAYGIPCIVPPVGGISELITEKSGFHILHTEYMSLSQKIRVLFENNDLYYSYSKHAESRSRDFVFDRYKESLLRLF